MVKEEITRKIRKYFEINENERKTYQNLRNTVWNAVRVELRRNLCVNVYIIYKDFKSVTSFSTLQNQKMKSKQNPKQADRGKL